MARFLLYLPGNFPSVIPHDFIGRSWEVPVMPKHGISVVKFEGDDLPESIREAGHSVCYALQYGLSLRGKALFTQEEVDEAVARLEDEIFEEMRVLINTVRRTA